MVIAKDYFRECNSTQAPVNVTRTWTMCKVLRPFICPSLTIVWELGWG